MHRTTQAIIENPLWPHLLPFIKNYPGQQARFEVSSKIPPALLEGALAIQVLCCNQLCNKPITPFRPRKATPKRDTKGKVGRICLSFSCRQDANGLGCSRGEDARQVIREMADIIPIHRGRVE